VAGGQRYLRVGVGRQADGTLESLWLSRPGEATEWLVRARPVTSAKRFRSTTSEAVEPERIQRAFDETLARLGSEGWEFAGYIGEDTYLFTHRDDTAESIVSAADTGGESDDLRAPHPPLAQRLSEHRIAE
jgi:hypothetical protein